MPKYGNLQSRMMPGPEAQLVVAVSYCESEQRLVQSILDTGASISCVPEEVILSSSEHAVYDVRTFRGIHNKVQLRVYDDLVKVEGGEEVQLKAAGVKKNYAIIGRDWLNGHRLDLDGPGGIWEVAGE